LLLRCIVNASEFFDSFFNGLLNLAFLGYICPDGKALSQGEEDQSRLMDTRRDGPSILTASRVVPNLAMPS